ncbi:hypothetical protein VTK56DRAFT_7834 [Thermocarpiscus australiensis]
MASRQWLSSAVRQCQRGLSQQHTRAFSTSAPVADLRVFPDSGSKPRARNNPNEALHGLLADTRRDRGGPLTPEQQREVMEQSPRTAVQDLRINATTDNYLKQMARRWRTGDVYAPKDLSPMEMKKFRVPRTPTRDIVDLLGFNPVDNYKNFSLISEFVTSMGRIKHSSETGLRPVNQRKMAKAIRRAIGMGLHPSVHRHPEILRLSRMALSQSVVPMSSNPSQNKL